MRPSGPRWADRLLAGQPPRTIELVEADETSAVVIVQWPPQPTVLHPRRFPDTAAMVARLFAEAATLLAAIKAGRRL
jgi:hypothetical protein